MREAFVERNTNETKIKVTLNLDGTGKSKIDTKVPFLDHMLTLFSKHGRFDLVCECDGDVDVDFHHSVEDIGISIGKAFTDALGDKKGINRYGSSMIPMDEVLILSSVDLSGRVYLNYNTNIPAEKVGDFDTELGKEFWYGFVRQSVCTLHIVQLAGENSHHILEGTFKSVARALKEAVKIDEAFKDEIPSTKGVL